MQITPTRNHTADEETEKRSLVWVFFVAGNRTNRLELESRSPRLDTLTLNYTRLSETKSYIDKRKLTQTTRETRMRPGNYIIKSNQLMNDNQQLRFHHTPLSRHVASGARCLQSEGQWHFIDARNYTRIGDTWTSSIDRLSNRPKGNCSRPSPHKWIVVTFLIVASSQFNQRISTYMHHKNNARIKHVTEFS